MSRFPLLTETFILREMLELERQGLALAVFPLLREQPPVRHHELEQLKAPVHYTPFLSFAILSSNLRFLLRNPGQYLALLWTVLRGNWGSANLFVGAIGIFPKSVHIARMVERIGVRHLHAHFATHPALCALIVSRLTGIGFSFTAHAHDIFLYQHMLSEKIEQARFVVAISEFNRQRLIETVPSTSPAKVKVLHCGVELDGYGSSLGGRGRPSRAGDEVITATCVASLQPYKGIKYLVRACAQVMQHVANFRCLIVGEGAERPELEALISELGLSDTVRLLGATPQHEVASLLRTSDLFVLPSVVAPSGQMDGIPVALMEAMASRLPVVSTRLSGIPELVDDAENGLLVPPQDESALADAITILCRDAELRQRMGRSGRARVQADFELASNVSKLRELFGHAMATDAPCASHNRRAEIPTMVRWHRFNRVMSRGLRA